MGRYLLLLFLLPVFAHAQVITTIAGTGNKGCSGDGGPATDALLDQPLSIAIGEAGNIYIVDAGCGNVRRVSRNGMITTIGGNYEAYHEHPAPGYEGDGGQAKKAMLWKPRGIAADPSGNLYFGDYENSVIRRISPNGGINTIAGFPKQDETGAAAFLFSGRQGEAAGNERELYFADAHNNMVHEIDKYGKVATIAGNGSKGYSGDGWPATDARLNEPWCAIADDNGNVYIADARNNMVRKIDAAGLISTIAGNGTAGYSGDGGQATAARMSNPRGLAIDVSDNLYIADAENNVVRMVRADGTISTFAGTGQRGYDGDNGPAIAAMLNWPTDVATDKAGNVYIADAMNHVVRKVSPAPPIAKKEEPVKEKEEPVKEKEEQVKEKAEEVKDAFAITADAVHNVLVITMDTDAYNEFTITDMSGRLLMEHTITAVETKADISTLQAGRYFIRMKKGAKVKTAMFVKDR